MKTLEEQIRTAKQELIRRNVIIGASKTLFEDDIEMIREAEEKIKELETRTAKF